MNTDKKREKQRKRICKLLCGAILAGSVFLSIGHMAGAETVCGKEESMEIPTVETSLIRSFPTAKSQSADPSAIYGGEEAGELMLCPGGMPFGVKFQTDGVTVVGFCDVETEAGKVNPGEAAGLKLRDVILSIDGVPLRGAAQLTRAIETSGGKALSLRCRRQKEEVELELKPVYCQARQRYQTGLWVRDSGAGIGTVTFLIPESGAFAGLGHGICDSDTGEPIAMRKGSVCSVTVSSVVKGKAGVPGELKGYFNPGKKGSLLGNTLCGVWGIYSELPEEIAEPIPMGRREELKNGKAEIISTLGDKPMRYQIEISNIREGETGPKCFTVKVTDPRLLAKSGGIVQGMSGSPIIQNGKLVGAVTHVLVNDPTVGYGIFLENMIRNLPVLSAQRSERSAG